MFISLGNIPSGIRNKPSNQVWILLDLLPIGSKQSKSLRGFSVHNQEYDSWILLALLPIGPKQTKSLREFSVHNQEYDSLETQHLLIE